MPTYAKKRRQVAIRRKGTKWGPWILAGLGGLLAWNLYSKTQAAFALQFLPGKIKSLSWNGLQPVIVIELQVQNTSNHSFNVFSIAGNVYTTQGGKDYLIGNVSDFSPVVINPNSVGTLDINIALQLQGVVSDLLTSFSAGLGSQSIKLQALANVDQLQVPLNYTYKLG